LEIINPRLIHLNFLLLMLDLLDLVTDSFF
jgi:hypothetical protein